MSRSTYDVKETYTGDGSLDTYTFDFKIEALTQLEIIELDDDGEETQRVRGDDTTYLDSVTFDAIEGGGTVVLAANLDTDYTLIILLANDAPTQPYEFSNKGTFTLKLIERGLDFLGGAIQRLAYRANQALRIHDNDDLDLFNPQFPPGVTDAAGRYLQINDVGDGLEFGFTLAELTDLVLPTATAANQVVKWNGTAWVADLYGGGLVVSATQDITSGGDITVNAAIQQLLKIQGDGGTQIASITPFAGTLRDGMVITLLGMSDANMVTIQYADITDGCLLKGDCYLRKGSTLTLVYDLTTRRFYELARN
jgi:hypothetical protein